MAPINWGGGSKPATSQDILSALSKIQEDAHTLFSGPAAVQRLDQLDYHLSTAAMAITALYEESNRMEGYKNT